MQNSEHVCRQRPVYARVKASTFGFLYPYSSNLKPNPHHYIKKKKKTSPAITTQRIPRANTMTSMDY